MGLLPCKLPVSLILPMIHKAFMESLSEISLETGESLCIHRLSHTVPIKKEVGHFKKKWDILTPIMLCMGGLFWYIDISTYLSNAYQKSLGHRFQKC